MFKSRILLTISIVNFSLVEINCINSTEEQYKIIKELAHSYANLMLTFDYHESPLETYYTTPEGKELVYSYGELCFKILNSLQTDHKLSDLDSGNRHCIFEQFFISYINSQNFNIRPITFKFIKKSVKNNVNMLHYDIDTMRVIEYVEDYSNINKSLKDVEDIIIQTINNYNYDFNVGWNITENNEYLPKEFIKEKNNIVKNQEIKYSTHHIIPANILKSFWKNRNFIKNKIIKFNSGNHRFNYNLILKHNKQKELSYLNREFFNQHDADEHAELANLQCDNNLNTFLGRLFLRPTGIFFRGPQPVDRSDDPKDEIEGKNVATIIGKELYDQIIILNKRMTKVNRNFKKSSVEMEFFSKDEEIENIFYDFLNLSINNNNFYPWNPNQWIYDYIDTTSMSNKENKQYQKDKKYWRIKTLEEWKLENNETIAPRTTTKPTSVLRSITFKHGDEEGTSCSWEFGPRRYTYEYKERVKRDIRQIYNFENALMISKVYSLLFSKCSNRLTHNEYSPQIIIQENKCIEDTGFWAAVKRLIVGLKCKRIIHDELRKR